MATLNPASSSGCPWLVQVLSALLHLHRDLRVVHRDLKPTNLLLDRRGAMKLSDFGVSGQLENSVSQCASWVRVTARGSGGSTVDPTLWPAEIFPACCSITCV